MTQKSHTPGPWSVDPSNGDIVSGPYNVGIALVSLKRADTERIVACVNALEGIPDPSVVREAIEALGKAAARFAHISETLRSDRISTSTQRHSFANDVRHMECEARVILTKVDALKMVEATRNWQRTKACLDQREAMCIPDDKTADELSQIEYDARRAACAACEAVGLIPEMMRELKL